MPGREHDDQIAMTRCQSAPCHDQAAIWRAREVSDVAFDFASVAYIDRTQLQPKRRRSALDCAQLPGSRCDRGISQDRCSRHARRDLLEQLRAH